MIVFTYETFGLRDLPNRASMAALICLVKEPALLLPKYWSVLMPSSITAVMESITEGAASLSAVGLALFAASSLSAMIRGDVTERA